MNIYQRQGDLAQVGPRRPSLPGRFQIARLAFQRNLFSYIHMNSGFTTSKVIFDQVSWDFFSSKESSQIPEVLMFTRHLDGETRQV